MLGEFCGQNAQHSGLDGTKHLTERRQMRTMRWNLTEHSQMHDDVFSEESDTFQHGAALHANTKELLDWLSAYKRGRWNLTKHSQMSMTVEDIDSAQFHVQALGPETVAGCVLGQSRSCLWSLGHFVVQEPPLEP